MGCGRDLGVDGGVVPLRVPEQDLDDADINAVLEEMGGETVPGCGPTRLVISAACAASTTTRWSCRVLIGFMACCPGNSQPSRCITPCWCPTFHHSRSRVSRSAWSAATSATRRPAS